LALPELTEYLFENDNDYEKALGQSEAVASGLLEWSMSFPSATFAYIEASCIGFCNYSGYACRNAQIIERVEFSKKGHIKLLKHVGISIRGTFAPFGRGFFGNNSLR
jgi:hypothetical protein